MILSGNLILINYLQVLSKLKLSTDQNTYSFTPTSFKVKISFVADGDMLKQKQ
jgi:hypothetical protein